MSEVTLNGICATCSGTGIQDAGQDNQGNPVPSKTCLACNGTGKLPMGVLDTTDLKDDLDKIKRRLKKIMDKLEIGD